MASQNGINAPVKIVCRVMFFFLGSNMPTYNTVYLICGLENDRVVLNNLLLENILYSFKLLC